MFYFSIAKFPFAWENILTLNYYCYFFFYPARAPGRPTEEEEAVQVGQAGDTHAGSDSHEYDWVK